MFFFKRKREKLLEYANVNAKAIDSILRELDGHIPETDKPVTDKLFTELAHRMFYQDTIYDVHGSLMFPTLGSDVIENLETYEQFDDVMKELPVWQRVRSYDS